MVCFYFLKKLGTGTHLVTFFQNISLIIAVFQYMPKPGCVENK